MALLGLSCVSFRVIHAKQQEHEDRKPRLAEKQTFCYVMQLLFLQSVIRWLGFFLSACVIGCRCQAGKCEMVAEKLADGIIKLSKSCTSAESETAVIIHLVCGAKEVWVAPSQESLLWKHCQAMLSAHFVGMAVWQTSGKGRTEKERTCQSHVYWGKYVYVWVHPQDIDSVSSQRAEPFVTVCQSLNVIPWCLCLASLNFLPFPSRLSCLHLVLLSVCHGLLQSPSSCLCCLFSPTTSVFLSHNGWTKAGLARLEYPECSGGKVLKGMMEKKPATSSFVSVALDKDTRGPGCLYCVQMLIGAFFLKWRMLKVTYKGCAFLNF